MQEINFLLTERDQRPPIVPVMNTWQIYNEFCADISYWFIITRVREKEKAWGNSKQTGTEGNEWLHTVLDPKMLEPSNMEKIQDFRYLHTWSATLHPNIPLVSDTAQIQIESECIWEILKTLKYIWWKLWHSVKLHHQRCAKKRRQNLDNQSWMCKKPVSFKKNYHWNFFSFLNFLVFFSP